jgi:uncharacterized membrane protein (UPF0127 family)
VSPHTTTGIVQSGLALLLLVVAASCGSTQDTDSDPYVEIRGQRVRIEIAETHEAQRKGLSGRDQLAWNHGLLFVYDAPGFYVFWMKEMNFDIDIVWIRDRRIVDIHHQVPKPDASPDPVPDGQLPRYRIHELVDHVLEVPSGYAQTHGWRAGDWVEIRTRPD